MFTQLRESANKINSCSDKESQSELPLTMKQARSELVGCTSKCHLALCPVAIGTNWAVRLHCAALWGASVAENAGVEPLIGVLN